MFSATVKSTAPNTAAKYPTFMKSIVGRAVKITLSISSSSCLAGTEDGGRAILVSSSSCADAPH
jgi:hypothetical protein